MRVCVIMPVFNERALLPRAFERVLQSTLPPGCDRTLILVDDGSTDGTADFLKELQAKRLPGVVVLFHVHNSGKGAAIRTGFEAALRPGGSNPSADIVLIHDADLEYDPADHSDLIRPILEGKADAVIGTRYLATVRHVQPLWHTLANRWLTRLSNIFSNLDLTDMECCLKAFTREVADRLRIEEPRFGVEPEVVAKVARMQLPVAEKSPSSTGGPQPARRRPRIYQVAVSYAGRGYSEGKKIGWRDGLAAIWCIVKYNTWVK